ncbi:MAG: helix-turn-helix domain-containing protein [Candidatus Woesearchaeota archaeon]|jgi:predicted transcriptional regulator
MDTSILEDLGLTPAEIKIYLTLLELGSSSAGKIIEKSKLQNSVTHRALNSLIEKGLISFVQEGKRRIYQATDPENFHQFMDEKKVRFDQILPELKQRQGFSKQKENALVFKGIRGIKEIYSLLISTKAKEYNTFGGGKRVTYEVMGETWWKNMHTRRIANKLPARQIFDETIRKFGVELNKQSLSQVKFLPQQFEQLTETVIVGNKVGIIVFTENPYGFLIEDKVVADSYRKQFELMWKIARK